MSPKRQVPQSPNQRKPGAQARIIYRLCFGRSGAPIWLGHLDQMRTIERTLLRANLPISYSQGFNPRPELVFALPVGVGVETVHDYVDVACTQIVSLDDFFHALSAVLSSGYVLHEIGRMPQETKQLMGQVVAADYRISFSGAGQYAEALQRAEALWVDKFSKGKQRTVDIAPYLITVQAKDADTLFLKVKAGSHENLRIDLVCQALVKHFQVDESIVENAILIRDELYIKPHKQSENMVLPLAMAEERIHDAH